LYGRDKELNRWGGEEELFPKGQLKVKPYYKEKL